VASAQTSVGTNHCRQFAGDAVAHRTSTSNDSAQPRKVRNSQSGTCEIPMRRGIAKAAPAAIETTTRCLAPSRNAAMLRWVASEYPPCPAGAAAGRGRTGRGAGAGRPEAAGGR
jgi:hypothetical protein